MELWMDIHELVMIEGRRYVCNFQMMTGVNIEANQQEVLKALTQQSGEIITEICDIRGRRLNMNQVQLDNIFTGWVEQDVNIKIHKLETIENPEKRLENDFKVFFLLCQSMHMVLANATLGELATEAVNLTLLPTDTFSNRFKSITDDLKYLLSAPDEEVLPLLETYTAKAFELYKPWRDSGEDSERLPQIYRYALFAWVLKRRAGLI
jgi:hypothetical protein